MGIVFWYDTKSKSKQKTTVKGLGIHQIMPPMIVERPGGFDGYLFMLFYHPVIIETAQGKKTYPPPTLTIWSPGKDQIYGNPEQEWNHSWFLASEKTIKYSLSKAHIKPCHTYSIADTSIFDWYIETMHRELITQFRPDKVILSNIVSNTIVELGRMIHLKRQHQIIPEKFLELRGFIEQNYAKQLTLLSLANQVHFSVPHMCRLFKSYFGVSPIDYLIQIRLRHTSRLLSNHNLRIGEIASSVGYSDIYQFSRAFKKYFGISPKEMRSKISQPTRTA